MKLKCLPVVPISRCTRFLKIVALLVIVQCNATVLQSQSYNIVLGRPTDTSITASILFEQNMQGYLEYGTASGSYTSQTAVAAIVAGTPLELTVMGLQPNTRYYYRLKYKTAAAPNYSVSPEYRFHTQRAVGSSFTFTIEADEHLYDKKGIANMYRVTLQNQLADQPDFMLSLGDIFGDDHNWATITSQELDVLHKNYRPFLGAVCHSIPFYVCLGNHEGENDYYYLQNPGANLCVWGTQWRKHYYPNPYPNAFYSGNTDVEGYGIGNPENYYAWTWGDAQFIVLDVYRDQCDTSDKPQKWAWSLGKKQYDWLKTTLESSTSKYKFVFAHHIRGQGRGGITNAPLYEWGGLVNGRDLFAANRPGWAKPIHKLFVDNKVDIFFQGHDHVFAHEMLDGITYQACPMPSDSTYRIGMTDNGDAYTADTFDGTGHLRVTVGSDGVKVDFVRAYLPKDTFGVHKNREVPFSYTVRGNPAAQKRTRLENVVVKPNPAEDKVTVIFPANLGNRRLTLRYATGNKLHTTSQSMVDLSPYSPGIYLLEIEADGLKTTEKILIQR